MLRLTLFALFATPLVAGTFAVEPNRGQFDTSVVYAARLRHGAVQWSSTETIFSKGNAVVRMTLEGARTDAAWVTADPLPDRTTYFYEQVIRDVPRFGTLRRNRVYPGIDWIAYGAKNTMEYDFVVAPGADPSRIRMRFAGATSLRVKTNGDLEVATAAGPLVQHRPELYQLHNGKREPVTGRFVVEANTARFATGPYDRARTLWIDPVIDSASFWGGSAEDEVVYAESGFVVGTTSSVDLPNSASRRRGRDVFVVYPGEGTLVFGGSGDDVATCGTSVARNSTVVAGGYTNSSDLPVTRFVGDQRGTVLQGAALQSEYAGGASDGFIVVFQRNSNFNSFPTLREPLRPLSATYFGSPGEDRIQGIWTSAFGAGTSIAITGYSDAAGLPGRLGIQREPRGGKDAFFAFLDILNGAGSTTYAGGSGDDEGRSVAAGAVFAFGGETRSADFPSAGGLNGPSDAFLITMKQLNTFSGVAEFETVQVFGGSGEDRINAVATSPGGFSDWFTGGSTTSSDFPQVKATPYAGGASDAFVQRWTRLASTEVRLVESRLFGGDGRDEALAVSTGADLSVTVAGRTDSTRLPVQDALQPAYGGGASDGFFARYELPSMRLYQASYLGGPGRDYVTAITEETLGSLVLAGITDAGGLPTPESGAGPEWRGGTEGFTVRVQSDLINAPAGLTVMQDTGAWSSVSLSGSFRARTALRVRSSDPNRLQVAGRIGGPGLGELTFSPTNGANESSYQFAAYALASSGSAELIFSADGYPERRTAVQFVPVQLGWFFGGSPDIVRLNMSQLQVPSFFRVGLNNSIAFLRPGVEPINLTIEAASSGIVTFVDARTGVLSGDGNPATFLLRPAAPGETEILVRATNREDIPVLRVRVVVTSQFVPFSGGVSIPTASQFSFALSPEGRATRLRLTSGDPSRLLVSTQSTQRGTGSIDFTTANTVPVLAHLQALTETGEVALTLQLDDFPPETITVRIIPPTVRLQATSPRGQLSFLATTESLSGEAGAEWSIGQPGFLYGGLSGVGALIRTPGFPAITVPIESSDPSVAEVRGSFEIPVTAPTSTVNRSSILLLKPGTALVRVAPPPGVINAPGSGTIAVRVSPARFGLRDFELGRGLVSPLRIGLPAGFAGSVVAESGDPSLMQLQVSGTPSGSVTVSSNFNALGEVTLNAIGRADSGETTLRLSAPGVETTEVRVRLRPAGFVWATSAATVPLHAFSQFDSRARGYEPLVRGMALDPDTRLPVAEQRSFSAEPIPVTSSRPEVGALSAATLPSIITSSPSNGPFFAPRSIGETLLTLSAPPGFIAPAVDQTMRIRVEAAAIGVNPVLPLGRDLQTPYPITLPYAREVNEAVTITSSDPTRLVISDGAARPGTGSLRMVRDSNGSYPNILLQALASEGTVRVTVSGPGLRDATTDVQLVPLQVMLSPTTGSFGAGFQSTDNRRFELLTSATGSVQVSLSTAPGIQAGMVPLQLRAGAPPLDVTFTLSDPSVATVGNPTLRFQSGETSKELTVRPVGSGSVTLNATPTHGDPSALAFTVRRPRFRTVPYRTGRDTQFAYRVQAEGNIPSPTPPSITIRSTDPSRLLVALDPAAAGSDQQRGPFGVTPVYIQALTEGEGTVVISADGYEDSTLRVVASRAILQLRSNSRLSANQQQGTLSVAVDFRLSPDPNQQSQQFVMDSLTLRGGLPPLPVTLISSNPAVAATSTLTLLPGRPDAAWNVPLTGAGETTLRIQPPPNFDADVSSVTLEVRSERPEISGPGTLGRDFQGGFGIRTQTPVRSGTPVTVTSSDPTRLLVSDSNTAAGQGSVTFPWPSGGTSFFANALGDSGTITITVSIQGYDPATYRVALIPSGPVFENERVTVRTGSGPASLSVRLFSLDPNSLQPQQQGTLRPGGPPYIVRFTVADPAIAAVSPASLTLGSVFNPSGSVSVSGLAPGSTLVRLAGPPGSTVPSVRGVALVTVEAGPFVVPRAIALGRDQQTAFRFQFAQPTSQAASYSFRSSDSSRLLLSFNPTVIGSGVLNLTFPPGIREGPLVYVQAIGPAPTPGNSSLSLSGGGPEGNWLIPVNIRAPQVVLRAPAGFPTNPLVLPRGVINLFLTAQYAFDADPSDPIPAQLLARPGVPVSFTVRSTDPRIVAVGTITPLTLPVTPIDPAPQINLILAAPGSAFVEIRTGDLPLGRMEVRVQ
ncbi:MAG: hypothetical protein K2X03_09090 [Bryobacteraceae bacterium]|nr:hypothetical protein [Bryobacteraceae bacterium]